ncbi:hypothetical protein Taro_055800 [Colocasia esculenta]|uniref:BHLH domain-containing protein n=1 Tax=Colocasia esculenta TaxID=4460 RepID=A0A843XUC5_COLES|nr:hypothetical protein [Colocasia esculenta]
MQMAGFPYQHHLPYYSPDFAYLFPFDQLPLPSAQQEAGDTVSAISCLPSYYPTFDAALGDVFPWENFSKVNAGTSSISAITALSTPTPESSISFESNRMVPFGDRSKITTSSSSARQGEAEPKTQRCGQKKRKDGQRCNSESSQSKDPEAGKSKKQRKRSCAKAEEKKAPHQIPTGYIHVRAKRGEATDSHSLAERVRRERIREKMKMLQDLVPGCDKVVGKALLLEEIINYVQSLQNQVEVRRGHLRNSSASSGGPKFLISSHLPPSLLMSDLGVLTTLQFLSMKLASMDPMGYDFGLQFDDYMAQTDQKLEDMSPGLPNVQRTGHVQPTAIADATKSYPLEGSTPPYLLHDQQGPSSLLQERGQPIPPSEDRPSCSLGKNQGSAVT